MRLPILHLPRQAVPQIVFLNGQMIGDTSSELVCPVSPDGTIYITTVPLEQGYLPQAMKLQLLQGQLIEAPLGGRCFLEGETIHLQWQTECIPAPKINKYPHTIAGESMLLFGKMHQVTLFEEQQVYLAIEEAETGTLRLIYQVEDLQQAKIEKVSLITQEDILINGTGANGMRCIYCTPEQAHYRVMLDENANAAVENGQLAVFCNLQDALGHRQTVYYAYRDAAWQIQKKTVEEIEADRFPLMTEEQTARVFAEAVLYRHEKEMQGCLEQSWDLSLEQATEFLGAFDYVYAAEKGKEGQILLLLAVKLFENAYVLHDFRCSFEQGRISNIETE